MRCFINGEFVNAELIEDMGWHSDPGMYVKDVLFDGKLYKVVSSRKNGIYREWTVQNRLGAGGQK